jgi:excisionase family DNA binding protein
LLVHRMGAEETLMSERELARYLNLHLRTVQKWRAEGKGPPVLWAGNRPRYRRSDVDAWLQRRAEEP